MGSAWLTLGSAWADVAISMADAGIGTVHPGIGIADSSVDILGLGSAYGDSDPYIPDSVTRNAGSLVRRAEDAVHTSASVARGAVNTICGRYATTRRRGVAIRRSASVFDNSAAIACDTKTRSTVWGLTLAMLFLSLTSLFLSLTSLFPSSTSLIPSSTVREWDRHLVILRLAGRRTRSTACFRCRTGLGSASRRPGSRPTTGILPSTTQVPALASLRLALARLRRLRAGSTREVTSHKLQVTSYKSQTKSSSFQSVAEGQDGQDGRGRRAGGPGVS